MTTHPDSPTVVELLTEIRDLLGKVGRHVDQTPERSIDGQLPQVPSVLADDLESLRRRLAVLELAARLWDRIAHSANLDPGWVDPQPNGATR